MDEKMCQVFKELETSNTWLAYFYRMILKKMAEEVYEASIDFTTTLASELSDYERSRDDLARKRKGLRNKSHIHYFRGH